MMNSLSVCFCSTLYPRKSNFSSGSLQTRVFVSFTISFSFVIMSRIVTKGFFGLIPTADHEGISIVNDVRFQTLLVPQLLPAEHEPAHVQIAQQPADRRTLWTPSTFVSIARASMLVSTLVRLLDGSFQPHLDQMKHRPIDDSASYRLQKFGVWKGIKGNHDTLPI